MSTFLKRLKLGLLVTLGLLAGVNTSHAQIGGNNPFLNQQQYLYNLQLSRSAFANSMGSANPSFAAPSNIPAYNPYLAYGANPYSPLAPTYGAGTAATGTSALDPYAANPYTPYSSSNSIGPGYTLMGAADVLRSYGSLISSQEQARLTRQQYYQSKLDTQKRKFDLEMYIKANTPTFTEEQEKITRATLRRIQINSSPAEISSGKSLNFILDDIRRHRGREFAMTRIPLDDYVLSHLNVTGRIRSLGMLRDGGKLSYPPALTGLMTETQRRDFEARTQAIVQAAAKGKRDANAIKDIRTEIDQVREQLRGKVNETASGPYLESMRWLSELDDAAAAIEQGEAATQFDFQKMVADGKVQNLTELVSLMVDRGWQFAPALQVDESAYRALHSALVAYDLALNSSVATAAEPKE